MQGEYEGSAPPYGIMDGREGLVLFFTVGAQTFAVRLTDVTHIEPFHKTEDEGERGNGMIVRGIGQTGEEVSAVDLHRFLGIEIVGQIEEPVLILLREGKDRFGLVADEVQAIVPGHEAPEMAWPKMLGEESERIYGGFFSKKNRLVLALNPDGVWDSAKTDPGIKLEPGQGVS
jgi:chemotaxis signal transduction protein